MPTRTQPSCPPRPWLDLLRKAYSHIDRSVTLAVAAQSARLGGRLACGPHCAACCRQPIPASAPELAGALWHLETICDAHTRSAVRRTMQAPATLQCPFLVDDACAVYPLRFMACRQFAVFFTACAPGEDVWRTRNHHLLVPEPVNKLRAFALLARLLGSPQTEPSDDDAVRALIIRSTRPVQAWDLSKPSAYLRWMDEASAPARS